MIPMYINSKPARIFSAIPKSIKLLPNIIFFIMLFLHKFQFVCLECSMHNGIFFYLPISLYITVENSDTILAPKRQTALLFLRRYFSAHDTAGSTYHVRGRKRAHGIRRGDKGVQKTLPGPKIAQKMVAEQQRRQHTAHRNTSTARTSAHSRTACNFFISSLSLFSSRHTARMPRTAAPAKPAPARCRRPGPRRS